MSAPPRFSPSFESALAHVLALEGGFVRHPLDPGEATNFGITRETLSRTRAQSASVKDVRELTREEAASIYHRFYWDAVRGGDFPPGIGLVVFDMAVNSGPVRAVRLLQQALRVSVDGVVGPRTLEAAHAADTADVIRALTRKRLGFLSRLATWPVFGRGWRRRVLTTEREAIRLASFPPSSRNGQSS
jgi:lysozyme family protein